jgi:methylated-DNA-protein-cysteine methyltransferase-like protein
MMTELPDFDEFSDRVYWVVDQIPHGQVATYGQVAFYAGSYGAARAVGTLLKHSVANGVEVPWQRVINAQGGISFKGDVARAERQRRLLEREDVTFTSDWKLDLGAFQWEPDTAFWGEALGQV